MGTTDEDGASARGATAGTAGLTTGAVISVQRIRRSRYRISIWSVASSSTCTVLRAGGC
jgi:hypothetical protein